MCVCRICDQVSNVGERVWGYIGTCQHVFHDACLQDYLEARGDYDRITRELTATCPLCATRFVRNDIFSTRSHRFVLDLSRNADGECFRDFSRYESWVFYNNVVLTRRREYAQALSRYYFNHRA